MLVDGGEVDATATSSAPRASKRALSPSPALEGLDSRFIIYFYPHEAQTAMHTAELSISTSLASKVLLSVIDHLDSECGILAPLLFKAQHHSQYHLVIAALILGVLGRTI
jgi:hypothetical protein